MKIDSPDYLFQLCEVEVETVRRAALERDLPFDGDRIEYTAAELSEYGLVRESYNSDELREMGIKRTKVVTSFDADAAIAREHLQIDAPFASEVRKWQIPVDICEWRMFITEFPVSSVVSAHVHPENTPDDPGGSLRTVLKGSIHYAGKDFGPGDWFYIPNGVPYAFKTNAERETIVMYSYAFFAVKEGNRFSHPIDLHAHRGRRSVAA